MEAHEDPDNAPSDGLNMVPLDAMQDVLSRLQRDTARREALTSILDCRLAAVSHLPQPQDKNPMSTILDIQAHEILDSVATQLSGDVTLEDGAVAARLFPREPRPVPMRRLRCAMATRTDIMAKAC